MARKKKIKKEEESFEEEENKKDTESLKENKKIEKKVVNKQKEKQPQLYSILELSDIFGVSVHSFIRGYSVRGMDLKEKISIEDAKKLL
jgi:hypothetical protein